MSFDSSDNVAKVFGTFDLAATGIKRSFDLSS